MTKTKKKSSSKKIAVVELTPQQKVVELAQDVLLQLANRRYRGATGHVISPRTESRVKTLSTPGAESVQKAVKAQEHCVVCAKGACFLAYIERFNNISYVQFNAATLNTVVHTVEGFADVFPPRLLAEIETLFERHAYKLAFNVLAPSLISNIIGCSNSRYSENSNVRLFEIMLRLVENEGRYVEFPEIAELPAAPVAAAA